MKSLLDQPQVLVHSFDLASTHPKIKVCDMSRVPLPSGSVDVVIFCLSLMNTNFTDALKEARRILKPGKGILRIAEVESRFESGPTSFVDSVKALGFTKKSVISDYKVFILLEFVHSGGEAGSNNGGASSAKVQLKPCLYKKR